MSSLWNSFSRRSTYHSSVGLTITKRDDTLQELLQLLTNSNLSDVSTHEVLYVGPGQHLGQGATFSVVRREAKGRKLVAVKYLIRDDDVPLLGGQYSAATKYRLRDLFLEALALTHSPVVHHRNIVDLIAYGWDQGGIPYLVVDYADLGSLDQHLRRRSVTPDQKTQVAIDVASALECLHACDIVHGDLKLENVLVFSDMNQGFIVKLSDFGFCCAYELGNLSYRGTSLLNAPEIRLGTILDISNQEEYFLCDIYAYGIFVWEVFGNGVRFYSTEPINIATSQPEEADVFLSYLDQQNADLIPCACKFIDGLQPQLLNAAALKSLFEMTLGRDPESRWEVREARLQLDPSNRYEPDIAIPIRSPCYSISDIAIAPLPWNVKRALIDIFIAGTTTARNVYRGADALGAAMCYASGFGVHQDMEQSFKYLAMSAQENYLPARVIQEIFTRHELIPVIEGYAPEDHIGKILNDAFSDIDIHSGRSEVFSQIIRGYYNTRNRYMATCPVAFTDASFSTNQVDDLEILIQNQNVNDLREVTVLVQIDSETIEYGLMEYLVAHRPLLAESLIRKGWEFDDSTGVNPPILVVACSCGATNVVRCLIELHPSMAQESTPDGVTALHYLFMFDDLEIEAIAELLVQSGCLLHRSGLHFVVDFQMVFSGPALHWAIMACNVTACRVLLELGAELNELPPPPPASFEHHTQRHPLSLAVSFFLPQIIKLLLDYGAVTYWEESGLTALHVLGDAIDRYRLLLYHGRCITDSIRETIDLLVQHIDFNTPSDDEPDPLQWIVQSHGSLPEVVEVFLQHPFSTNADYDHSRTLEMAAMSLKHDEVNATKMVLLLDYLQPKLDKARYRKACITALTTCVIDGTAQAARVLLERLSPETTTIIDREELLHIAAQENHVVIIDLLLEYGASINNDAEGIPAAKAAYHCKTEALSTLLNRGSALLSQPMTMFQKSLLHEIASHHCSHYEAERAMALICEKYSDLFLPIVDNYDKYGLTALQQSVVWGNLKIAALLVQTLHASAIPVRGTNVSPTSLGRYSLDHLPWEITQQSKYEVELHRQQVLAVISYLVDTCKMEPPEDDVVHVTILRHLTEPIADSWKDDDDVTEWYRKSRRHS